MSLQEMMQALLRSRLYRTRVVVELEGGRSHEGRVTEIRYDGSRSAVILVGEQATLPLCRIVAVRPVRDPRPRRGEAA